MKRSLILTVYLLYSCAVIAQYSTPGNGVNFNPDSLVFYSQGSVTGGSGEYYFHDNIVISLFDTLSFENNSSIYFDANILIDVQGYIYIDAPDSVCFNANNEDEPYCGIKIDGSLDKTNANNGFIKNLKMLNGGGIKCMFSNVEISNCYFYQNKHQNYTKVIDIFFSNVSVSNSDFIENAYTAIGSPANEGNHVAKIENCNLLYNGTNNNLNPQINLGPSGSDTIVISQNTIKGRSENDKVGGISIATLAGGSVNALISDNAISDNSYGINQYGNNINSLIANNVISSNNINPNVMSTGSGIIVNGPQTTNYAKLRNNIITNNHWGIVNYNNSIIDLGTIEDYGLNEIYDNGNNEEVYNFNNMTPNDINAIGNWWGTVLELEIEGSITHQPDDASHGLVTYTPWLDLTEINNNIFSYDISIYPNPCSSNVNLKFNSRISRLVKIANWMGQICYEEECFEESLNISTSDLTTGYYFVIVISNSTQMQLPLIIE